MNVKKQFQRDPSYLYRVNSFQSTRIVIFPDVKNKIKNQRYTNDDYSSLLRIDDDDDDNNKNYN